MAARTQTTLLTADDYGSLPEVPGFRDELIEGERVLAPMAKASHTVVVENVEEILRAQVPHARVVRESGWSFQSPEGFDNVPGPDLMVLSAEDYDRSVKRGGWFEGHPLFIIEVVSPSERKSRRLQKVGLYLEAGAGAVVEIDYTKRILLVHSLEADAPIVIGQGRIEFPFTADLSAIFARLA